MAILDYFDKNDVVEERTIYFKFIKSFDNKKDFYNFFKRIKEDRQYIENSKVLYRNDEFEIYNFWRSYGNKLEKLEKESFGVPRFQCIVYKSEIRSEYKTDAYIFCDFENFVNRSLKDIKESNDENKYDVKIMFDFDKQCESSVFQVSSLIYNSDIENNPVELTEDELWFKDKYNVGLMELPTAYYFKDIKNNEYLNQKIVDRFLLNISNENEKKFFKIYGPKIIEIKKSDEKSLKTSDKKIESLVDLWNSLMDKNRYNDKLEFIRQGFATYLPQLSTYENLLDVSDNVLEFYNKSFESYVQNSIDIFLKQKDHLIDAYDEETRKMFELTDVQTKKVSELVLAVSGTFLLSFLNENSLLTNLPLVAVAIFLNLLYGLLNLEFVYKSKDQKDAIQGRMALTSQRVNNILPNTEDVKENIDEYSKFFDESIEKFDKTRINGLIRISCFCGFLIIMLLWIAYYLIIKK